MRTKKYILTNEINDCGDVILHRIKALRDFGNVKAGDLGGWIEDEENLSHEGNCWVSGDAKVYGNARVFEDAKIEGYATVCENAMVHGKAEVWDLALIYGNVDIYERARISGEADIFGNSKIFGDASVTDLIQVYGNSRIYGRTIVNGVAQIHDAEIKDYKDYIVFRCWWSAGQPITWTRSNNLWLVCGSSFGITGEKLAKCGREEERIVKYVESILEDERTSNNNNTNI